MTVLKRCHFFNQQAQWNLVLVTRCATSLTTTYHADLSLLNPTHRTCSTVRVAVQIYLVSRAVVEREAVVLWWHKGLYIHLPLVSPTALPIVLPQHRGRQTTVSRSVTLVCSLRHARTHAHTQFPDNGASSLSDAMISTLYNFRVSVTLFRWRGREVSVGLLLSTIHNSRGSFLSHFVYLLTTVIYNNEILIMSN
jgi:hypothetical protein